MILIPRSWARDLRAVFRRLARNRAGTPMPIELVIERETLTARGLSYDGGAHFQHHCAGADARVVIPIEALADCEGKDESLVTVSPLPENHVELRWTQNGVPHVRSYDVPEVKLAFPEPPSSWKRNSPGLLDAVNEAVATVAPEFTRYALDHIQLRGSAGEIIGTDSKQLLIQSGFEFPWADDVLLSRYGLAAVKALPRVDGNVHIGRTEGFVWIRTGPWSLVLPIDTNGRFPDVHAIIPSSKADTTRLLLDPQDADLLVTVLPDLPGTDDPLQPVTVDLNGSIAIRAKDPAQLQPTELLLQHSRMVGAPMRVCLNRLHLSRSRKLGFESIDIVDPNRPVVCRNGVKTYVAMPLDPKFAIPPSEDALRVGEAKPQAASPPPIKLARADEAGAVRPAAASTTIRKSASKKVKRPSSAGGPLEEAAVIQNDLRGVLGRLRGLVALIRRQRREHRLVKQTLASLKDLQRVG